MIQISVAISQMLKMQVLITIFENGIISTLRCRQLAYDVYLKEDTIYLVVEKEIVSVCLCVCVCACIRVFVFKKYFYLWHFYHVFFKNGL